MLKRLKLINGLSLLITIFFLINCGSDEGPVNQPSKEEASPEVGAPQSLTNRPGRNRIELSWTANSGINIQSYKIFWNNRKDSITGEVPTTNQPGTIRVMLSNLDEGLYQFYVYHYDKDGNSSNAASSLGNVYGDTYSESLKQRKIISLKRDDKDVVIQWVSDEQNKVPLIIEYFEDSGKTKLYSSTPGSNLDRIPNVRLESELKYKTGYLPAENALDTFYTDYRSVVLDKKVIFTHPGVINDETIFNDLSISALGTKRLGALSELNTYISNRQVYDNYPPIVYVTGPGGGSNTSLQMRRSSCLAYALALRWVRTGNEADAQNAIKLLNGWASSFEKLEPIDNTLQFQPQLVASWQVPIFAAAAEILKTYRGQGDVGSGWYFSDIEQFNIFLKKMLAYVNLMIKEMDEWGTRHSNWGASAGYAKMSAGVFLDDKSIYEDGLRVIKMLIPDLISSTGQVYELCERDCGHPQYTMNAFTYAAEIARIQSDLSLYEADSRRILTGYEWILKAFSGEVDCRDCAGSYVQPGLEVALNYYRNNASSALLRFAANLRPFAYYRSELFLSFTTLTHYREQW